MGCGLKAWRLAELGMYEYDGSCQGAEKINIFMLKKLGMNLGKILILEMGCDLKAWRLAVLGRSGTNNNDQDKLQMQSILCIPSNDLSTFAASGPLLEDGVDGGVTTSVPARSSSEGPLVSRYDLRRIGNWIGILMIIKSINVTSRPHLTQNNNWKVFPTKFLIARGK